MAGKFGNLAANVEQTFKVEILDPISDMPLQDNAGVVAYVEVLSADSETGRLFDKNRRRASTQRVMRGAQVVDDQLEENQTKLAKLTRSWHLVDPMTREPIDVECNEQNALELFTDGGMQWLYRQIWVGASNTANFIKRPSTGS